MSLSESELERHKRHILLKEIGGPGVQKLRAAKVSIIGAGALGGPCAMYLAAAGVGTIEVWDDDRVDLSNLQRQIQFAASDVGQLKVARLAERLHCMNSDIGVVPQPQRFSKDKVALGDILIDATDQFESRFEINEAAHRTGRYLVSGAASGWSGQVSVFASGLDPESPCYRCLVSDLPPTAEACDEVGVVGALTGQVASMMALEAVKLITGAGQPLIGRLQIIDGLSGQIRTVKLRPNTDCQCCGL